MVYKPALGFLRTYGRPLKIIFTNFFTTSFKTAWSQKPNGIEREYREEMGLAVPQPAIICLKLTIETQEVRKGVRYVKS